MLFATLNKPPLSTKPPLKSTWKNKPPGGLIQDLRYTQGVDRSLELVPGTLVINTNYVNHVFCNSIITKLHVERCFIIGSSCEQIWLDYLSLLIIAAVCPWNIAATEPAPCESRSKKYLVLIDTAVTNFHLWILSKNKDGKAMYVLHMTNTTVIGEHKII